MQKSYKIDKRYFKLMILCSLASLFFLNACDDDININIDPPSGYRFIDYYPSCSPNGTKIAYIHNDAQSTQSGLYIIDTNGSNNFMLINNPYINSLDYSPDGFWIVFGSRGQIYKIKTNSDSLTQLTFNGSNYYPSCSPDGKWIVYDSNLESPNGMYGIWKMLMDGSSNIRIAYEPNVGEIRMPKWSSNDNVIVVQKFDPMTGYDPEITTIDTLGTTINIVTYNGNWDEYPSISPNGQKVIFTQQEVQGVTFQIYSVNTEGTNLTKLTNSQGYTSDYSPSGEYIVYCDSSPNNGYLWIMKEDGTQKKQLTH